MPLLSVRSGVAGGKLVVASRRRLDRRGSRLMEQPSMGTATRWHTNTVKPMAKGASTCGADRGQSSSFGFKAQYDTAAARYHLPAEQKQTALPWITCWVLPASFRSAGSAGATECERTCKQTTSCAHRDVGFEGGAARVGGGKHHEHQDLCVTEKLDLIMRIPNSS